jgi:multidrug efflux pump subunit AcrB
VRERIDAGFHRFREERFRPLVAWAIRHRHLVSVSAIAAFILALSLIATGWLKFTFFPPVDGDQLRAVVEFSSGTDRRQVDRFLSHLEDALNETNEELGDIWSRLSSVTMAPPPASPTPAGAWKNTAMNTAPWWWKSMWARTDRSAMTN